MHSFSLFLNTRIENQGICCALGNAALIPYRYLFNGRTIRIIKTEKDHKIHHVLSFHPLGNRNTSLNCPDLSSSKRSMLKTALAIMTLLPGLFVGVLFKTVGYLFTDVQKMDHLVRDEIYSKVKFEKLLFILDQTAHNGSDQGFSQDELRQSNEQINKEKNGKETWEELALAWNAKVTRRIIVGKSKDNQWIQNEAQLKEQLSTIEVNGQKPIDAVIVLGKDFQILEDPGLLKFNPMKIILYKVKVAKESRQDRQTFYDTVIASKKWIRRTNLSYIEALNDTPPLRSWIFWKRWHVVYEVNRA